VKNPFILLSALALASCAPPKAIVIQEAPKTQQPAAASTTPVEKTAALPDDGLRLGDMLTLPDDNQLRSAAPTEKDGNATIITSPPGD
jgi:hypothetical protein